MTGNKQAELSQIVGNAIMAKRKLNGLSQAELAERLGIEQNSLSRIEKGIFSPRLSRLQSIADALGCSVADLFRNAESPTKANFEAIGAMLEELDPEFQKIIVELVENTVVTLKKIKK